MSDDDLRAFLDMIAAIARLKAVRDALAAALRDAGRALEDIADTAPGGHRTAQHAAEQARAALALLATPQEADRA